MALQKNNENTGVEANSSLVLDQKEKDKSSEYFSERAKKLTTAVYLVTGLIPQTDPLRLSIRELSIKLLSLIGTTPVGHSLSDISTEAHALSKKVLEMLEVAFFSGYVSQMNFSVLKTEFDLFANEILDFTGAQENINPDLLQSDFSQYGSFKPQNTNFKALVSRTQKTNSTYKKSGISSTKTQVRNPLLPEIKATPSKNVIEAKKMSRKEAILSIIKLKGSVNIKDVSSVVINCSEKTIQRELTSLVETGVLKRTGERRWSVYSLA